MWVARSARDAMLAHADEGAPEEVVGVLVGERTADGEDRVTRVERARNAADTPRTRYELDPAEQVELVDDIEAAGDAVVGFYHSHPDGPEGPSATDARRAAWEGYVYAIVSLAGEASLGAWRWTGEEFDRLPVAVG